MIAKGGEAGIELGGKTDEFYDDGAKERSGSLKSLNTSIKNFDKVLDRKKAVKSMYRREEDYTPDYYDSVKIAGDTLKIKKNEKPFVDMKK